MNMPKSKFSFVAALVAASCLLCTQTAQAEDEQVDDPKSEKPKVKVTVADADEPNIKLESTFFADREQPAVSYFIPWKGSDTPDKLQWDMEQKHDATLQLIDRDVMLRSMNIYDEMNMEQTN